MSKLVEFGEYQDSVGRWHVGYFKQFSAGVDNFVLPARALGMTLDNYYKYVIDNFQPTIITHNDKGLVIFGWTDYSKAHSLVLLLNRNARKKNLTI